MSSTSSSDPDIHSVRDQFFTVRGGVVRLVRLDSAGLAVCTLLYLLAPFSRYAETTTHFVTWYALFGVLGTVASLAVREQRVAMLCAAFTLFYVALIAPWYWPLGMSASVETPNLRVLSVNLLSINEESELLIDLVAAEHPELIVVQELSPMWVRALQPIRDTYPYHVERGRSDLFGIGIYSRLPLENTEVFNLVDAGYPAIRADVQVNGRLISILNMHTAPPLLPDTFTLRNDQLKAAATFIEGVGDLAIVAGDINITMWSPYYRRLESESEVRNVRRGIGILPTWPTNLPFFRIALDHILVSPEILTIDVRRGPDIGSDHLPLIADLFVSARGTPEN